jgi:HEAT repeat protein
VREQVVFAYSQRREPEAVDRLMEVARRDADPELRKKAIFWLGQSRDPRAAQLLLDLLDR